MSDEKQAGLSGGALPATGAIILAIVWGAFTLMAIYQTLLML
jgi:hypothetical protein